MIRNLRDSDLNPETAKDVEEEGTVEGMRRRIYRYRRDNPLTHHVLVSAEYRGLSGDDTMTWLAYEALKRLEKLEDICIDEAMRSPAPVFITKDKP